MADFYEDKLYLECTCRRGEKRREKIINRGTYDMQQLKNNKNGRSSCKADGERSS